MIVESESQERWCGFCGDSVVPVLLPAERVEMDCYGYKHYRKGKPRWVCPNCHRANLRLCDRASTGRALKQTVYTV